MSSNEKSHEHSEPKDEGRDAARVEFDTRIREFRKEIFEVLSKHEDFLGQAMLPMAIDIIQTIKVAGLIDQIVKTQPTVEAK